EPRASSLAIRLDLAAGEVPAVRDLAPRRLAGPIRVGDAVEFRFLTDRPCAVALIDVGTSGAVNVLLPNQWSPPATVAAGQVSLFPDAAAEFDFEPTGPLGTERVVALAWQGELTARLAPLGDAPFRALSAVDVTELCRLIQAMPPERWSACVTTFEVVA
ncbi:MAG TPA: DUF4384 domain-containing protein, partial [Gemmataceae bacterium]|nr:DUF4384 domain-containing protein [Gemmataceae bacterium]